MALKRVIDADTICADRLFLRESAFLLKLLGRRTCGSGSRRGGLCGRRRNCDAGYIDLHNNTGAQVRADR